MLSNLKAKIINVGKNVGILNSDQDGLPKPVNTEAGAEILDHFKLEWESMHDINESNSKIADETATKIGSIYLNVNKNKENIESIIQILTNSSLINNIIISNEQIIQLSETCEKVENSLIQLEKLLDDVEFQNLKNDHDNLLAQYKLRKEDDLRTFKHELEKKHAETLIKQETENKRIMEERQKVFQEAFRNDLEIYKHTGSLPKVTLCRTQPSALLEEIQLDFDGKQLEQFFEDNS